MNKLSENEIAFIISRVLDNMNDSFKDDDTSEFAEGKRFAYYEILDTIKNELIVRDIDLKQYHLDGELEKMSIGKSKM